MRTFKGFVQYGNTLASMYEDNGQTYVEPISSFSDTNSVIDLRQQQQQQGGGNNVPSQYLQKLMQGSGGSGASSFGGNGLFMPEASQGLSSGATTFGGSTEGMTLANMGTTEGGLSGYSSSLGATEGLGASSQGGISGMSGGSGSSAGMGAAGYAGIILAAIAAQHYMSNNTEREFEGVKTDDAFSGNFLTEPWQAYMYQGLGIDSPTMGEKFDAAVENKDWGSAFKRSFGAFAHDPVRETIYSGAKDKWGKTTAAILDPGTAILDWLGG